MPQTRLQRIATNWTWVKHFQLHANHVNSGMAYSLRDVPLSVDSQRFLKQRALYTELAIKAIEKDVNRAKAAIRAEEKLATSVAPEKEFNSGIYDGQDI